MIITDKIVEDIEKVRKSGKCNMFDTNCVQRIAFDNGYYELVDYIESDRKGYGNFILTGDRG